jgi:hypothetical protein
MRAISGYCVAAVSSIILTACGGGGGATPSPNGATIVPPSSATITDGSGNVWSVAGGQIYEDGILSPVTENVVLLFYWNGLIYQQTSACGVWYASGSNWDQTVFPQGYSAPSSVTYSCPGLGGVWTATPSDGMTALMLSSGVGQFFYETVTNTCVGLYASSSNLALSGSPSNPPPFDVSGAGPFKPESGSCGGGSTAEQDTFTGSLNPASTLSLTSLGGTSGQQFTIGWQFSSVYNQPSSLTSIAGTWSNWTDANSATTSIDSNLTAFLDGWASSAPGQGTITIDASGAISANDVTIDGEGIQEGCITTGQVSIINQYYNMYSFTATITCYNGLPMAQYLPTQESGLMYVDTTVTPNKLVGAGTLTNLEADSNDTELFTALRQ